MSDSTHNNRLAHFSPIEIFERILEELRIAERQTCGLHRGEQMAGATCNVEKCCNFPVMSLLGKKYTLHILHVLRWKNPSRFSDFSREIEGCSPKTLSSRLDELREKGLINRKSYNEIPPRVEYSLTEKGRELLPVIMSLHWWTMKWSLLEGKIA